MTTPPEIPLLSPNDPVDLDNCAREPIHIPGSIQPHGVLLAVDEATMTVVRASTTLATRIDPALTPEAAVGRPLREVLGAAATDAVLRHLAEHADIRERNPVLVLVERSDRPAAMDAILHRTQGLLIIELEDADGPRPFEFGNSYQLVRSAVAALNRTVELEELYAVAAERVRELTGFDRVMIYRFDAEYNGEVVAEARREDLNPFLGLHYPATDIPAQARALYEKNWLRLIADVDYTPSPVLPVADPATGEYLDLTHAVLRSVSPIHLEYLRNMGVRASMSISLLRDGKLWGLVACHHYAGPHLPPYGVRAASEFLGSVLSLRLVSRVEAEATRDALAAEATLGRLAARLAAADGPVEALLGEPNLLDLIEADGAFVLTEGRLRTLGRCPGRAGLRRLLAWVGERGGDLVVSESLGHDAGLPVAELDGAAGLLAITLPDGGVVGWLREEVVRSVDWGGDPHNKELARTESGDVRLSPRKSFDLWREVVQGRCAPWSPQHVSSAERLRSALVESLFAQTRRRMVAAELFQRSLLPQRLPKPEGWDVAAWYEPASGGQVGGDWYDAITLPDGRTALVVGDVAGHGIEAAGAMAQLQHALRAYLVRGDDPVVALAALDDLVTRTMPDQLATLALALVDPDGNGVVEVLSVGHLPPVVIGPDGAAPLEVDPSPPLGTGYASAALGGVPVLRASSVRVPRGGRVVLFTDGLLERRDESLEASLATLAGALAANDPAADPDGFIASVRDPNSPDDTTLVVLRRDA